MSRFYLTTPSSPHREPINHTRGNSLLMRITARNEDGTPYDFTGHSFRMQIRRHSEADTIDVDIPDGSFTLQQNQEGVDAGVMNQVVIEHTKDDFLNLLPIEYFYDIEVTDGSGLVFTPQYGPFKIKADITQ